MMRRFTSAPKPSARDLAIHSHQRVIELVERRLVAGRLAVASLRRPARRAFSFVGAIAVVDAVVAGQIARGFAGGDDVVRGDAVLAVRQRNLFDRRAERFVNLNRFADGRFDFAVEPGAEMLADQAEPQSAERLADRLRILRHGHIERRGIARIVAGDRFQQQARHLRPCAPTGRSDRGCWRTRPGRSG